MAAQQRNGRRSGTAGATICRLLHSYDTIAYHYKRRKCPQGGTAPDGRIGQSVAHATHWAYGEVRRKASGCARNHDMRSRISSIDSSGSGPDGATGRADSSATTPRKAWCSIGVDG